MSGAVHTPGPWEFRDNGFGEEELVSAGTGQLVAFAAWTGGSGCELRIDNPWDKSLIAAAPELLEALEYLVGLGGGDCLDIARAAIAKAKGGAL